MAKFNTVMLFITMVAFSAILALTSCSSGIEVGQLWQDIDKPTSDSNSYKIVLIQDGFVYDMDTKGVVRKVKEDDLKKYCIPKQYLWSNVTPKN